jgi:hypothetical protein
VFAQWWGDVLVQSAIFIQSRQIRSIRNRTVSSAIVHILWFDHSQITIPIKIPLFGIGMPFET